MSAPRKRTATKPEHAPLQPLYAVPPLNELPELLITAQVAEMLNCSQPQVRKLVRRGELRCYRYMGRTLLFRPADVMEWYAAHMVPTVAVT